MVTLSLFRFEKPQHKLWAFVMMGLARPLLNLMPNLIFWKLLGSGTGEGFTPKPNWGVYAILCVWQDPTNIEKTLKESRVFRGYHEMATESVTIHWNPMRRAENGRDKRHFAPKVNATLGLSLY